ncbi:MAG: hypothetical protein PSX79_12725, partial [bacterium]|nr:hypothetical protein [bacterium]
AIYPTPNSVSNRFFQNVLNQSSEPGEIPDPPEWSASRETNLVSQPIILKNIQNNWSIDLTSRR